MNTEKYLEKRVQVLTVLFLFSLCSYLWFSVASVANP